MAKKKQKQKKKPPENKMIWAHNLQQNKQGLQRWIDTVQHKQGEGKVGRKRDGKTKLRRDRFQVGWKHRAAQNRGGWRNEVSRSFSVPQPYCPIFVLRSDIPYHFKTLVSHKLFYWETGCFSLTFMAASLEWYFHINTV